MTENPTTNCNTLATESKDNCINNESEKGCIKSNESDNCHNMKSDNVNNSADPNKECIKSDNSHMKESDKSMESIGSENVFTNFESDKDTNESENVWVKIHTLKDAPLEEVNENSDLILVVGDIDTEPPEYPKFSTITNNHYMICNDCGYKTRRRNNLIHHIQSHNTPHEILNCSLCTFSTKIYASMSRHIAIQHKTRECTECPYKTIHKRNFTQHKLKHKQDKQKAARLKSQLLQQRRKQLEKFLKVRKSAIAISEVRKKNQLNGQYACDKCSFRTIRMGWLIRHEKIKHVVKTFLCSQCAFITTRKKLLTTHIVKVHEVKQRCSYCSGVYKGSLRGHLRSSLSENLITCPDCDFESYYYCEYKKHQETHPKEPPPKKVKKKEKIPIRIVRKFNTVDDVETTSKEVVIDGQTFPRKPYGHIKFHKSKLFLVNTEYLANMKTIPIGQSFLGFVNGKKEYIYKCGLCTFTSNKKASVNYHAEKEHTDNKSQPYLCINCSFTNKNYENIKKHVLRAQKLTNTLHYCDKEGCDFFTKFVCQLKMHVKTHWPYVCQICNYIFHDSKKLNKHNKDMHSNSLFKCALCEFTTARKDRIIDHGARHTGEKQHKCMDCDYSCRIKSSLNKHIQKYHSNAIMETEH